MKKSITIKIVSGVLNLLTCLAFLAVILIRQNFFGKGDTSAFIYWTVPLAVGLSFSGVTILSIVRPRNFLIRLAYIVLCSGLIAYGWYYFVYLILGPWINTFSFPIFYLWLVGNTVQLTFQVWQLPDQPIGESFLKRLGRLALFPAVLIGTVIVMSAFSLAGSFINRPAKELYLIPSDFEGKFRVVYGEECGIEPVTENGRRVLEIPENGILIIRPEFKAGTIDNEYYFIDKNGNRQKISILWSHKQRTTKSPGVILESSGVMNGEMPDGGFSTDSPFTIQYTDFTIVNGDTASLDNWQKTLRKRRLDSLTTATVNECRRRR